MDILPGVHFGPQNERREKMKTKEGRDRFITADGKVMELIPGYGWQEVHPPTTQAPLNVQVPVSVNVNGDSTQVAEPGAPQRLDVHIHERRRGLSWLTIVPRWIMAGALVAIAVALFLRSSPSAEEVAAALQSNPAFMAAVTGPAGPAGPQGETGKAADPVQVAANLMGNPTFLSSVKGERGERGEVGPAGSPGPRGLVGPAGPVGPRGEQGLQGIPGAIGQTGLQGNVGPTGSQGPSGSGFAEGTICIARLWQPPIGSYQALWEVDCMTNEKAQEFIYPPWRNK